MLLTYVPVRGRYRSGSQGSKPCSYQKQNLIAISNGSTTRAKPGCRRLSSRQNDLGRGACIGEHNMNIVLQIHFLLPSSIFFPSRCWSAAHFCLFSATLVVYGPDDPKRAEARKSRRGWNRCSKRTRLRRRLEKYKRRHCCLVYTVIYMLVL